MEYKFFKSFEEAKEEIDDTVKRYGRDKAFELYNRWFTEGKDPKYIQAMRECLYTLSQIYPYEVPKRKITWIKK